jgi:uncharacterized protein
MSFIESIMDNDLQRVKTLIVRGLNINAVDYHGRTALWWAAIGGHVECAAALIDAKADVDKADEEGEIPLHRASYNGRAECVRLLLQHKANVNALDKSGRSTLHYASFNGHLACLQILVAAGGEIDRPSNYGSTPLTHAIMYKHTNVAEFLLHSGAKMSNIKPHVVKVPDWMHQLVKKRETVMCCTLVLKGVLKRRRGLSKDVSHLIALHFWRMRLK